MSFDHLRLTKTEQAALLAIGRRPGLRNWELHVNMMALHHLEARGLIRLGFRLGSHVRWSDVPGWFLTGKGLPVFDYFNGNQNQQPPSAKGKRRGAKA